ncbi:hypothetical protein [Actinospongicola halichondriae]|uniref:hypothetical protein n=1 Tax=Actinospongicola halichondriae TaxID=3236844 RepID=UPI003D501838
MRMIIGGVVIALVAAGVGFALGGISNGDDDTTALDSSSTTAGPAGPITDDTTDTTTADGGEPDVDVIAPPTTIDTTGLESDALALAEAINFAAGLEYHARYEGEVRGDQDTTIAVEVWRRLPRARRDTTITGTDELHTLEFRLPDGLYGCIGAPPDVEFSCFDSPGGSVDPSDPVLGAVDPRGGLVISRKGEFAGEPVDCWEVESLDDPTTALCVDADGIPVVIDGGDGRLLRTLLDQEIDSTDFEMPAEVGAT